VPKRSYEDFAQEIARYQAPPTVPMLQDLIMNTVALDPDDVDERTTDFARSRIELAYRTGNVETHLRHLYDVLCVLEREITEAG
jgi:hypothetical protein